MYSAKEKAEDAKANAKDAAGDAKSAAKEGANAALDKAQRAANAELTQDDKLVKARVHWRSRLQSRGSAAVQLPKACADPVLVCCCC